MTCRAVYMDAAQDVRVCDLLASDVVVKRCPSFIFFWSASWGGGLCGANRINEKEKAKAYLAFLNGYARGRPIPR